MPCYHDAVIKWEHLPLHWPFVRGIHRWQMDSPYKGQCGGALFSLICTWTNGWENNRDAGDLRCHGAYHDATVMIIPAVEPQDLARNKPAWSADNNTGGPASLALDGNGATHVAIYTFSTWPWMAVDLGGRVTVEKVLLKVDHGECQVWWKICFNVQWNDFWTICPVPRGGM